MPAIEILVYGVIGAEWSPDGVTAAAFARQVAAAEAGGAEKIVVRINSLGGDAFDGIAMHNTLANASVPTETVVDGIAASAASVLLQGGDERRIRPGAIVMVHNPWTLAIGTAADLRKTADDVDVVAASFAGIYAERSGMDVDGVVDMMDAETWLSAADAVEAGLADGVMKSKIDAIAPSGQGMLLQRYGNIAPAAQQLIRRGEMSGDKVNKPKPAAEVPSSDDDVEIAADAAMTEPATADSTSRASAETSQEQQPSPQDAAPGTLSRAYVREVFAICETAGVPEMAPGFIDLEVSAAEVTRRVLAAVVERQKHSAIDGLHVAESRGEDPYNWQTHLQRAGYGR